RFVHRVLRREWRREVIHARHAGETGGFGGARAFDDRVERHAHLREEEMELGRHRRASRRIRSSSVAVSRIVESDGSSISAKWSPTSSILRLPPFLAQPLPI